MKWGIYAAFFGFSTIKFLFTPFGGAQAGLSFFETYFSCVSGGIFSAAIFYFSSEYFLKRSHQKKLDIRKAAELKGIEIPRKKIFTRGNKLVVRMKRRLGIVGISMFAPLFLSVPIGSIISAKFYGKDKRTFWFIGLGMLVNGAVTTGITYGLAFFI